MNNVEDKEILNSTEIPKLENPDDKENENITDKENKGL